jgi:hypothetical protein
LSKTRALPVILILVLSFVVAGVFFSRATQYPYGWADDDAYFYSQIAYNIAVKGVSSFDGVHVTDGYHLLWMGILAAVSKAVSFFTVDKNVHIYFMMIPSLFLVLFIPWRFGRSTVEKLILLGLSIMGKLLMETHLLVLLFLVWFETESNPGPRGGWRRMTPLIPVLLIPLARIDASVMVFVFSIVFLIEGDFRKWAAVIAALGIGAAVHFLIIHSVSGHWLTVSSVIKASESSLKPDLLMENLVGSGPGYTLRALVLLLLAASSGLLLIRGGWRDRKRTAFAFLAVSAFAFGHLYFSWLRAWYYVPGHLITAVLFFRLARDDSRRSDGRVRERASGGVRRIRLAVTAALSACIVLYVADRVKNETAYAGEADRVRAFIRGVERIVPDGEMIFQRDGSGYTGYFCARPIFNGDGLVNSHEYASRVVAGRLHDALGRYGIRYLISNIPSTGDTIDAYRGLVVRSGDVKRLLEKEGNGSYFFTNYRLFRVSSGKKEDET